MDDILDDDHDGREGQGKQHIQDRFADPEIESRQDRADPDRVAPFTGDQLVQTQFAAKPVIVAPLPGALPEALEHLPGTILVGDQRCEPPGGERKIEEAGKRH